MHLVYCLCPLCKLFSYYSSIHMPYIERKLQQSLNRLGRWCDEKGFRFSLTKTMCVHFFSYKNNIGLICDSKLSLIPHITALKSICTNSLDIIKVVSNTTWGLIEKFYYVCIELWFDQNLIMVALAVVYKAIGYCSQPGYTIMFRSFAHITSTEFVCGGE